MKKITLLTIVLFSVISYAQVGINTNTPDASSALEVESTTGGILIPRLTETQRDAISSPATGLMIYQTDQTTGFYFYDGTAWARIEGVAGQQGEPGPTGPQGLQGVAGNDGADGTNGTNGTNGSSAYEIWIAAGNTGTEAEFLASLVGAQGLQGDQGVQGETGAQGPAGPQGQIGPAGADGQDGAVGATGPTGPQGPAGPQGIQGLAGADGQDGATGPQGEPGTAGPQGDQGLQGIQGEQGPIGPIGNTGPQGDQGIQGETGAQGPIGPIGNTGPQGDQGIQGATGPQGSAGTDGNGIASTTDNNDGTFTLIFDDGTAFTTSDFTGPQGDSAISSSAPVEPNIGDALQGGIVAYILQPTDPGYEEGMVKGLIAAAEDFSNGGTYTFTNVDPQSVPDANVYNNSSELIGSGQANTNLFVASTGGVGNYAPVHANNYSVTVDGLTYDDWYLPSRNELKKLYANRSAIGNFTTTGTGLSEIYQSSSSYPTDNRASFFVRFSDGWSNFETQPYRVRFVRSFTLQAQTSITVDSFVGDLAGNATSSSFVKGGTAGQIMISQGTSTPTWVSPGTSGNVLTSDGSTWISQTMPSNGIETVNGTANEIEVSTSNTTTTIGLPDNTTISTSLTVNGLYFGNSSGGGNDNLAIGSQMGSGTGHRNTALGKQALDSYAGTSFDNNTAVGYYNLKALTTGSGNTGLGAENMFSLTTGSSNTGVGNQTMLSVTTGNQNTGLGQRAGQSITTGSNNTLLGFNANVSSGSANNETVIGKGATGSGDNTVQLGNTSVTNVNTSGTITAGEITIPNTDGTSGQVLTTDGSGTLSWTTSSAGVSGSGTANMIAKFDGSSTVLGNSSVYDDGTNVGIGTVSPAQLLHVKAVSGDAKVLINANGEDDEAHLVLRSGGINKTAIVASGISNWGRTDLRFILNSYTNANDYGLSDTKMIIKNDGKVGIGTNSPTEKLDVAGNIKFNGALMPNNNAGSSGQVLTSSGTGVPTWTTISGGASNIDELSDAIHSNQYNTLIIGTTPSISAGASYSTGVGKRVLESITTGDENVAMGHQALGETTSGSLNTAMGSHVIFRNTIGSQNSAFGKRVLENNTTGSNNTGIGASAGDTNTTGTNNTLIGYNADLSSNNLTNATAIGANATVNTSNKIKLGNSNVTNVETAGSITAGAITIPNTDGTSGQVLATDGSGTLSWSTPSSGATTYSVGDMAQGGKVFWVDSSGQHGLVVALEDAGGSLAMDWNAGTASSGLNLETLAQSSGIYAGRMNTAIIIAVHAAAANNGNNFAARACNEYTYTQNGVEYADWYLPSKDELHLIKTSGVGAPNLYSYNYWSSTEYDANNAYAEVLGNYANNYNQYKPKDTAEAIKVRAVRSF